MRVGLSLAVFFLASGSDLGAVAESSLLAPGVQRVQALTPNASGRLLRGGKLSVKVDLPAEEASPPCRHVVGLLGGAGDGFLQGLPWEGLASGERCVRSPSHICRRFSEGVTGGGPAHHR